MKKPELLRRGEDMIKKEMIAMLLAGGQGSRLRDCLHMNIMVTGRMSVH